MGSKSAQIWCYMVSFLHHIVSILYELGLTCGDVYPLWLNQTQTRNLCWFDNFPVFVWFVWMIDRTDWHCLEVAHDDPEQEVHQCNPFNKYKNV